MPRLEGRCVTDEYPVTAQTWPKLFEHPPLVPWSTLTNTLKSNSRSLRQFQPSCHSVSLQTGEKTPSVKTENYYVEYVVCYVGNETFYCQVTPPLSGTCNLRVCLCVCVGVGVCVCLCVCATPVRCCVEARGAGFLRLPAGWSGGVRDCRQHHQSHLYWRVWAAARQGARTQAERLVCMWVLPVCCVTSEKSLRRCLNQ